MVFAVELAGLEAVDGLATLNMLWAECLHCRVWWCIEAGLRHRLRGICILDMRGRLLRHGAGRARLVASW
jgi:hypothetical protein